MNTNMNLIEIKRRGRKPVLDHVRRMPCHSIRLEAWVLFWLKSYPREGARMIEKALLGMYKPDKEKIVEEFYKKLYGEEDQK